MLKAFWKAAKLITRTAAILGARLLLAAVYFVAMLPFGLAVCLLLDPLKVKKRPVAWVDHPPSPDHLEDGRRQG